MPTLLGGLAATPWLTMRLAAAPVRLTTTTTTTRPSCAQLVAQKPHFSGLYGSPAVTLTPVDFHQWPSVIQRLDLRNSSWSPRPLRTASLNTSNTLPAKTANAMQQGSKNHHDNLTGTRVGESYLVINKKQQINGAIVKHRKYKFFESLNNAHVKWDLKAKPRGLLGGHLNIRSIMSKYDQVQSLLSESNLDFLCISETWLHKDSPTVGLNVLGYNIFRKDRLEDRGGGVMFYVREHLSVNKYNGRV